MKAFPGVVQLLRLPETDSTQTVARFLAAQGAPDGTLVWADRQTSGRGRLERTWDSAKGGLYFSLIRRPALKPSELGALSLRAAAAVAAALAPLGVETRVKKPNDVLATKNGKSGKLSGILIEASGGSKTIDWVVLGVGINVNNTPTADGAVSLKGLTRHPHDVENVLRRVLTAFISL